MDERSLNQLESWGSSYFKESLFKPKPMAEMRYNKNYLQIGRTLNGKIYGLDLTEAVRIVMIGATRSGKTWNIRQIADRLSRTGRDIVFLPDIKNEFGSSRNPLQPKFRHLLLPGEVPKGMKVVSLRPTFFKSFNPDLPKDNFWYSINFKRLTRADFMTLMNSEEMTSPQKTVMEIIFQNLQDAFKKNPQLEFNLALIESIIDGIEEINNSQKISMKFKFKPLEHSHFYEKAFERDLCNLIQNGFIPAFNYENFDAFGKGNFLFPEVILSVALREIIMARRSGKLKTLWIFMDECLRFIGENKNTSVKYDILESVDLDTRYGVNYCFASQTISQLPPAILRQARYVFVPATSDVGTIRDALMSTGLIKNIQIGINEAIRLKSRMQKTPHSWLVIDRTVGVKEIIIPLSPLSEHIETST